MEILLYVCVITSLSDVLHKVVNNLNACTTSAQAVQSLLQSGGGNNTLASQGVGVAQRPPGMCERFTTAVSRLSRMLACSNFSDTVQDSLGLSKVRWWDSDKHSSYSCGIMLLYSGKFGGLVEIRLTPLSD